MSIPSEARAGRVRTADPAAVNNPLHGVAPKEFEHVVMPHPECGITSFTGRMFRRG